MGEGVCMELVSHKKLIRPFVFRGEQCIVVPVSPHVIRIFYDRHVYDVLLTNDELNTWRSAGTDWQREYIHKLLDDELIGTEALERNASILDGYLA